MKSPTGTAPVATSAPPIPPLDRTPTGQLPHLVRDASEAGAQ